MTDPERQRMLGDARPWRLWGPYLSERAWGTVREDYSADGTAWEYRTHDQARSRAYRWGEDGIAGFSDEEQRLCVAIALWNEHDPILKERLFGLSNQEGNHGEDVKEVYYYLDATPSHSYLRMLYKYPHGEYPYSSLVAENRRRTVRDPEFELCDTGLLDDGAYFDVFVEWAKADPEDLLLRVRVENRGKTAQRIHVIPQIWFRNTWSYKRETPPRLFLQDGSVVAEHPTLGRCVLLPEDGAAKPLFTNNESRGASGDGHDKDGFHERIVRGDLARVSPDSRGTKAAFWHVRPLGPGETTHVRLRLRRDAACSFTDFDAIVDRRREEADAFYEVLQADVKDGELRRVQRQALAGMVWSKQFYHYDVRAWLQGDPGQPEPPAARRRGRNRDWVHLNTADILSMPDKWEFPWFSAWDLALQCVPLALVDPQFAKEQLVLFTREWYMHPNGQLPAYEWSFGDANPPVHAWAAWKVYQIDAERSGGKKDRAFLERVFHKLLLNFTWWVNRHDADGRSLFQGGFLGLDNVGVVDRNAPVPGGGRIDQADGTSWMAAYSLHLMRIALELAQENHAYEDIATKFFEHFLQIAEAMADMGGGGIGLWDEADGFFYDAMHGSDGSLSPMRLRSIVGLTPLFAVTVLAPELLSTVPDFTHRLEWFLRYRPDLAQLVSRWSEPGRGEVRLLSLLRGHRMKMLYRRMLDEGEFLSPYGVRSLSKYHAEHPYAGARYEPGESQSRIFGGNSNWRGPVWLPVNFMLIDAMREFYRYYGDDFRIECPTGSGTFVSIAEAADAIASRLVRLFVPGPDGVRPCLANGHTLAGDPHFRDHVLFHEYFHGDTGLGLGASHQTGWTGLVASLIDHGARP